MSETMKSIAFITVALILSVFLYQSIHLWGIENPSPVIFKAQELQIEQ